MRTCFYLAILLPFIGYTQINHWETLVYDNDSWNYTSPTSSLSDSWILKKYDDSNWNINQGGFGFGDDDDSTILGNVNSVFLRKKFIINDSSSISSLILHIDYDDGFVAFLNGAEIGRKNMGINPFPDYNAFATKEHEANLKDGGLPEPFSVEKGLILNDTNLLCIQVHNHSNSSNDLSARIWLSAGINNSFHKFSPTPIWFEAINQDFKSKLPLIFLNTEGQVIKNNDRINCKMAIIENGNGALNSKFDSINIYNGNISIEIRGHSSSNFPKKQFSIETQDEFGDNLNVSLFGWPKENDWILYAPYSDKTLLRNVLAYKMSNEMGHYAPRTKLCEVFIDNKYEGVYVFTEKIKRDSGRVNISKLKKSDLFDDEVTGGYIFEIDREDPGNHNWISPYAPNNAPLNSSQADLFLVTTYPKKDDIKLQQENYIEDFISQFETNLKSNNFDDPILGYSNFIDINSFIDFFIVQEVSRNVDAYRLSSYFHKNRNKHDSLIHAGPVWDFNLSFGNADYCDAGQTFGWAFNFNNICNNHSNLVPFWWERLLDDEAYQNKLKCRWNELRVSSLRTSTLLKWIDSQVVLLNGAQQRNFTTWDILNLDLLGNNYIGGSYEKEVAYYKAWLTERLSWMDKNMFGFCDIKNPQLEFDNIQASAYPNPFTKDINVLFEVPKPTSISLKIIDCTGEVVHSSISGVFDIGRHEINLSNQLSNFSSGVYFIKISNSFSRSKTIKIIKIRD